jgi:N4-gp56 family major capsid protein
MSRILKWLLTPYMPGGFFSPALVNQQSTFAADVSNYIEEKTLPLARRQLIAYQFGEPLTLPMNSGLTYTASRYERLPLPFAPLQEGVAPVGSAMTLQQVTATAQQWGDRVIITDVANLTIKHPLFQKACELVGLEMPETLERNTYNTLMAATQVNYANSKASRALIAATDVMSPTEVYKIVGSLTTYGAPQFAGDEREDMMIDADKSPMDGSKSPAVMQHYVSLIHPLPEQDMRQNSLVATAWSYSDINRLYNNDLGAFGGVRFCKSNMIPYFVGVAAVTASASLTGGSFATGNYNVSVTGAPAQTSVEQRIYQVQNALALVGPTASITLTTPNVPGYVFNVYVSAAGASTGVVTNLGTSALGPTSGPMAGQATQLPPNTAVTITGTGVAQTAPGAPATGVTVFPTFFLGRGSYGQVVLQNPEFQYLRDADKSDPLNQTRVVAWKVFYGSILLNQAFLARVESSSAFSPGYTAGTQS